MATKTMKLSDWFTACRKAALSRGDAFERVTGPPVSAAAEQLGLTKQRVHQLVQNGDLESISVTAPNGTITLTLITEASLNGYLAKRAPARRGGFTLRSDEKLA